MNQPRTSTTADRQAERRGRRLGFVTVSTLFLWLSTGIAAAALWSSYRSVSLIVLVVATTIVASIIAILGAVFRWSSMVVMAATIVAFLTFGVPLAVPDRAIAGVFPSLDGMRELVVASALSWKQLLTISLPVGSYESLLVPAFILILVTVVVSLSVALRTKFGELGVIGPIVIFVVAILFGPSFSQWPFVLTIGLTVSLLFWLVWRRWYRRREAITILARGSETNASETFERVRDGGLVGVRAIASAGLILAIAAAASIAATTVFPPTGDRVVLRSAIVQPFDPHNYPSPLSGFRKYEQQATVNRDILTVSDLPVNARIRVATMDTYDGIVYSVGNGSLDSSSGSFTRVPLTVDQSATTGTTVTFTVTINDYSGVWLPTVGKLKSVDFMGPHSATLSSSFYYNDNSDTAAVVTELVPGDDYTVTAILPAQPSPSEFGTLEPGTLDLPPVSVVPDELSARLDQYVSGVDGAGHRLVAMLAGLKRDGYVSHGVSSSDAPSRSGHAADRITELFSAQTMIGDQEQYAVTAALMARQLGFPARVVFGFEPKNENGNGVVTVKGNDVSAWIEVNTTKYGWVAIDPTPNVRPIPEAVPEDPTQVARPQAPVQPQLVEPDRQELQVPQNTSQEQAPPDTTVLTIVMRVLAALGWSALVVTVLLSPFLLIVAAKWRRRRLRRYASSPLQRISGGWREFEDSVLDHGYNPGPSPTRIEVAQAVGGTQPFVLAAVTDRAIFSPDEPDNDQAEQLWRSVAELRFGLDAERTTWERIKALVSLRSLGGYSVKGLFRR